MAKYAMRTGWLASAEMSRSSSIYPRTLLNAPASPNVLSSTTIHIQRRSLFASLGGTTALFVGASVLTVVETAFFFIRGLVRLIFKRNTRVVSFKP